MAISFNNFHFKKLPSRYELNDDVLKMVSRSHTDLWQNTYYGFCHETASMLLLKLKEKFFSFSFKVKFDYKNKYDQAGLVLHLGEGNWLKAAIEYGDLNASYLGSVVTNNGFSDWAFQGIPTSKKEIYYRLSRRENDFLIEFSFDGKKYYKMRVCHLLLASGDVDIGMYVASPNDSSFEAEFSNLSLTTCVWKKE